MTQRALFFEGIEAAAEEIARHYPNGAKALAHRLRPTKTPEAAHRWWLDCCNTNRTEHNFSGEDWLALIKIGREIDCHAVLHFICDEADYERPRPVQCESEISKRVRAHKRRVEELAREAIELEELLLAREVASQ